LAITEETTPDDLLRLLDGPNWTERAKSVERIAALYCDGGLDTATQRRTEDAFRALRYDGEDLIRRLLAECLKDAAHLPRDIAFSLATDKPEIAAPFLVHSPALADRDLIAVLRDHAGPHRLAVTRRQTLSTQVSDAVCRCGSSEAILALLSNDGAAVSEATLHWLLEEAPVGAGVVEAIARRKLLPIGIGERLRGGRTQAEIRGTTALGRAAS
jgi:uncharacterized protein (DUF2336 family)